MTFGLESSDVATTAVRVRGSANIKPFLDTFYTHGHSDIDTARIYGNGDTEQALGQCSLGCFSIATKVWPVSAGAHQPENIRRVFRESLMALGVPKVETFYLHAPDFTTPWEESCKAVDELYKEGLFDKFGLSNYSSWQVAQIHGVCKQHGYVLPVVYQGMYNPITRDVSRELLPCLKALGMAFEAYNPIAGGLLTGKYQFDKTEINDGSRFDTQMGFGKIYRERFWNHLYFEAIQDLSRVCAEHSITLLEATLRWMMHHAGLHARDGVVIGVSSVQHLEENLQAMAQGPLPTAVVVAFDEAWEEVKVACPSYFKTEKVIETYLPQSKAR
ncbi:hypothetical protein BGZ70_008051 [Mortierella alpina]|uniref:NADP-dependent oxidoreductase domain-containing protein n=1 Tax=Mortierella alpina TaxID=64518 RepID=A0A9P6JDR4_MORAP|nr:hypothetical protein BGZ70_008051 [Mortierella alpina]